MDEEAAAQGFSAWLDKTPSHIYYVKEIAARIPDVQFIFTVRNAVKNVLSLAALAPEWKTASDEQDLAYAISRWFRDTSLAYIRAKELSGYVCDYDALTDDPQRVASELFGYLGLPVSRDVLDEDLSKYAIQVVTEKEPWKQRNLNEGAILQSEHDRLEAGEEEIIEICRLMEIKLA